MCKKSFINYKNKKIRYGVFGFPPEVAFANYFSNSGSNTGNYDETTSDGTTPRFMKMLAERLNFYPTFTWAPGFNSLVNKVDHLCEESRQ